MKKQAPKSLTNKNNGTTINARQLSLFLAFFLPVGKILELPSLLARGAGGDLLLPALLGSLLEFAALCALLLFAARSEQSVFERLENAVGKWAARALYGLYAAYLLCSSALPILDLEKFSHAAFSDTEPTFFSFTPFFILSGFICTKAFKSIGRCSDLSPALFLIPFLGLILLSVSEADFSSLLPLFEKPFSSSAKTLLHALPHFPAGGLLLPLMSGYKYEKGDAKKVLPAFGVGSLLFWVFLAVFYSVYGTTAAREHYALAKIAQYFPALNWIGRIDLLLVYTLTIQLFFFTALPLQLCTHCVCKTLEKPWQVLVSAALNLALFFAVLFLNRHYDNIYEFFTRSLWWVFLIFSTVLPLCAPLLAIKKGGGKASTKAKKEETQCTQKTP